MFLTVYLSNNEQHFSEVPITPETLCRDVVELCKEPGEADCYLAEAWRGAGEPHPPARIISSLSRPSWNEPVVTLNPSEHVVGEGERMVEVLQRWGQQGGEVRYLLRHQRAPARESGERNTHTPASPVHSGRPRVCLPVIGRG